MGKKMNLPFLFKAMETPPSSWPWVTCTNPKTLSFRANNDVFKTMNSAYFTNSDESESISSASEAIEEADSIETVIKGLRSERLFFEPGETSSILEESKTGDDDEERLFRESVAIAMDSTDPFLDFRKSMEEMVEVHGLKDWDCLEEMLTCYLRVNGKSNHGYIVGAFIDLLVSLSVSSSDRSTTFSCESKDPCCSSSTTHSFTSPLSFYSSTPSTSPCLSSLEIEDEIEKSVDNASSSSLSNVSNSDV